MEVSSPVPPTPTTTTPVYQTTGVTTLSTVYAMITQILRYPTTAIGYLRDPHQVTRQPFTRRTALTSTMITPQETLHVTHRFYTMALVTRLTLLIRTKFIEARAHYRTQVTAQFQLM